MADKIIIESLFKSETGYDKRHVLNLSDKIPNVDLEDIEKNGVSIEQLSALNVPICRYQTQVTIHGLFQGDTRGYCRATGFKSLVRNENNSIGVRWVAIDGAKKALIRRCLYAVKTQWDFVQNSQGTELHVMTKIDDCPRLIEIGKAFPRACIVGHIGACRAPLYGIAWLYVTLAAIPEAGLWRLIEHLTGLKTLAELEAIEKAKNDAYEAEQREREKQRAIEKEEANRKREAMLERLEKDHGLISVTPEAGGHYVRICKDWMTGGTVYKHCAVSKSFGRLIAKSESLATLAEAIAAARAGREIAKDRHNKGKEITGGTFFKAA